MRTELYIDDAKILRLMKQIVNSSRALPMRRIATIMLASVNRNFKEGGRPSPWKKLSENTRAARKRGGDRPLRDTGGLEKSVHAAVSSEMAKVYTDSPVSAFHQHGTRPYLIRPKRPGGVLRFGVANPNGGGRDSKGRFTGISRIVSAGEVHHPGLPARPFMVWQDEDIDLIQKTLLDHLLGK